MWLCSNNFHQTQQLHFVHKGEQENSCLVHPKNINEIQNKMAINKTRQEKWKSWGISDVQTKMFHIIMQFKSNINEEINFFWVMIKVPVLNFYFSSKVRFDNEVQRIVQEPVELAQVIFQPKFMLPDFFSLCRSFQEYRKFDLAAPWEQFPSFREPLPATEEIPLPSGTEKK